MAMIFYHHLFSPIFLSWDIPFALACPGFPESISEVVLVLKRVSQYLCQWPLPAGQVLMDVFEISQINFVHVIAYGCISYLKFCTYTCNLTMAMQEVGICIIYTFPAIIKLAAVCNQH